MTENFPELENNMPIPQEAFRTQNSQNQKNKTKQKTLLSYSNLNSKYAEQREYIENNKREITCHNKDKLTKMADYSVETLKDPKVWNDIYHSER